MKWLLPLLLLGIASLAQAENVTMKLNGAQLNANLEKSSNWPAGPVILMTHGTLAHNRMEIISTLQSLFAENGISSLAINLSLGIDNRPSAMYDCATPHRHKHTDALKEIEAWLEWLKVAGTRKVVLLGHSRGGNQAAWFTAEHDDPTITKVILLAPQVWSANQASADYEKRYGKKLKPILDRAFSLVADGKGKELMKAVDFIYCPKTKATAEAFLNYYETDPRMDTPYLISKINKPVLVFVGSEDKVVKGLERKLKEAGLPDRVEVRVIEGADHYFRDLYAEEVVEQAIEFIKK
jgi:alpha-beta hydrolase superfamily lysophospholipase